MNARHYINLLIGMLFVSGTLEAQPGIQWKFSLGGDGADYPWQVMQTQDGGYAIFGNSSSTNGDVTVNHGLSDFWIVKLNPSGIIQWQKSYGGLDLESYCFGGQTSDGGFYVAMTTQSADGIASGSNGYHNVLVLRLDEAGDLLWSRVFGYTCTGSELCDNEVADALVTNDDGLVILSNWSLEPTPPQGSQDNAWLSKLDAQGNLVWEQNYGGSGSEGGQSLMQTPDGGFIFLGSTNSNDGIVSGFHGGSHDIWVVKVNALGFHQWNRCYGTGAWENPADIEVSPDGGYFISGFSTESGGDMSGNHGTGDAWVAKLTSNGCIEWERCMGGSTLDEAWSLEALPDGSCVLASIVNSTDGDVMNLLHPQDVWLTRLGWGGDIVWQRCLGGSEEEWMVRLIHTADNGYLVAASSESNNGNVTGHHGSNEVTDIWVAKLYSDDFMGTETPEENYFSVYPNPSSGTFQIHSHSNGKISSVRLLNAQGQLVYKSQLPETSGVIGISVMQPAGIYLLEVSDPDGGIYSCRVSLINP